MKLSAYRSTFATRYEPHAQAGVIHMPTIPAERVRDGKELFFFNSNGLLETSRPLRHRYYCAFSLREIRCRVNKDYFRDARISKHATIFPIGRVCKVEEGYPA